MVHVYLVDLYCQDEWRKYVWITGPITIDQARDLINRNNERIGKRFKYVAYKC